MSTSPSVDLFRLDGKVAILTGASSGLGNRFAKVLSDAGATVVLAARRADRLEGLTSTLPDAIAVPVDLTSPGATDDLVQAALLQCGQIDIVVNNAGISRVLAAVDDDIDGYRQELEINLIAPYELARKSAKWMIDNGREGSVVNVGSILGAVGGGRLKVPGYASAKGGLHNLTRELASQWARKGVRCNAIAPGWFETEMNSEMFGSDGGMSYITEGAPMGRPGQEGELDGALLYLASNASSYVTGQVLFVDGGWTAV
ncbi:MAG: NAD(P)-dependent dehydrogenase (short-subunit alcohol dehydrogenase family) [Acidimicrobiales bacterium]|jgi:NAD(P)-dependent dehydrogenase (short-subunit alcohol dehydrogenase family)